MKVLTDLTAESPEVDIDFENGTKLSIYRSPEDGKIRIFVDLNDDGTDDVPIVEYDIGYR